MEKYYVNYVSETYHTIYKLTLREYGGNKELYEVTKVQVIYGENTPTTTPRNIGKNEQGLFDEYNNAIEYLYGLFEYYVELYQNKINELVQARTDFLRWQDRN